MEEPKYTGLNRFFQSDAIQAIMKHMTDGTLSEFIGDWKWIFSFTKKYRWIVVFYTVVGIVGSTLSLGSSYVGRILINIVVGQQREQLWVLICAMLGMTLFSLALSSVSSRIFTRISIYVNNDIQGEIFDRIMDARWAELSAYPSGDLLNRFNGDVGTIAANAINWIPNLIINIYTFAATFIILFRMDPAMAWIALLSAPFLLGMSRYIMRRMKQYRKRVLELNSQMMGFEVETFFNFDMIKSFGVFGYYSRRLRDWQKKFKEYNLDYNKFEIKSRIMLTLVSTAVSMAAFGYCLYRLWNGQILYGDMTFFLQQRANLSGRFNDLVGTIPGMLNSSVSAHRIRELIDLPREIHDEQAAEQLEKQAAGGLTVRLSHVSFGYQEQQTVYRDASFEAKPGEIVAVLASSGGGKTTLMRLLLGMLSPQEGGVSLVGADGVAVPMNADARRFFAYVPQGNAMLSGTIAENMRIVREDATDEEIIEALKTACAWEFVEALPGGINGVLRERGRGISEGQAQRISIARALLRRSPILLLDEATSALDVETEERVLHNIIQRDPNKVIIIATHRPSALKLCSRIYRITEDGIAETDRAEAERLMRRYAELPPEPAPARRQETVQLQSPLQPREETEALGQNTNKGWWNV